MKNILRKISVRSKPAPSVSLHDRLLDEEQLSRQVAAVFALLSNLYGSDKLVLKAGKIGSPQIDAFRSVGRESIGFTENCF